MILTKSTIELNKKRAEIIGKLNRIRLPKDGNATSLCWTVGTALNISGPTVKNYLNGDVKDGYLAEAIYSEFVRLGFAK